MEVSRTAWYDSLPLSPERSSWHFQTHMQLFEHLALAEVRKCFPMLCLSRPLQALFSSHLRLRDSWEGCSKIMVTCCPNGIEPVNNLLGKTAKTNIKTKITCKNTAFPKRPFSFILISLQRCSFSPRSRESNLPQTPEKHRASKIIFKC